MRPFFSASPLLTGNLFSNDLLATSPAARVAPTIVMGMHRSGTGLVTQLLRDLGLGLGRAPAGETQSRFFTRLNSWVFAEASASWSQPEAVRAMVASDVARSVVTDYLATSCDGPRVAEFLGPRDYLRFRSAFNVDAPWGWRDDRGAFTLPLWLDLFPDARVVNVVRHGVDVADSMARVAVRHMEKRAQEYDRQRWRYGLVPRRSALSMGPLAADLDYGLQLWDTYLTEARDRTALLGDQVLEVRFEELVEDPATVAKDLAEHCGLSVGGGRMAAAVDIERKNAFCADAELVVLSRQYALSLERHGYTAA